VCSQFSVHHISCLTACMCSPVCMYAVKEFMCPIRSSSATVLYGSHAPGWHVPSDSK
jgi:hypothetical protein